ncbi:hypothetical protein D3C80_1437140 [compost metagenome]
MRLENIDLIAVRYHCGYMQRVTVTSGYCTSRSVSAPHNRSILIDRDAAKHNLVIAVKIHIGHLNIVITLIAAGVPVSQCKRPDLHYFTVNKLVCRYILRAVVSAHLNNGRIRLCAIFAILRHIGNGSVKAVAAVIVVIAPV